MTKTPTQAETVATLALKPFRVGSWTIGRDQLRAVVNQLANMPERFMAIDFAATLISGETLWVQQEATNRLMQRWRKLGLCRFDRARWSLTKGAWDILQSAANA